MKQEPPVLQLLARGLARLLHRTAGAAGGRSAEVDLVHPAPGSERIAAAQLVAAVLGEYPFRDAREATFPTLQVFRDFEFLGAREPFFEVIENLVSNALRALARCPEAAEGDLLLEVDVVDGRGRIRVSDRRATYTIGLPLAGPPH